MKLTCNTALATFLLAASSDAANIIANSLASSPDGTSPAKQVVSSAGAALPVNSLVRVGFFNDPAVNIAILAGDDFAAIDALFTPLGENPNSAADGTTGPIRINATGQYGGSIQNVASAYAPENTPLYVWVLNQSTADANATEWAIFRDATWRMPNEIGSLNLLTWQIDEPSEVIRGTLNTASNQIRLAPAQSIPEPGAAALALAAMVVLRRRRR